MLEDIARNAASSLAQNDLQITADDKWLQPKVLSKPCITCTQSKRCTIW